MRPVKVQSQKDVARHAHVHRHVLSDSVAREILDARPGRGTGDREGANVLEGRWADDDRGIVAVRVAKHGTGVVGIAAGQLLVVAVRVVGHDRQSLEVVSGVKLRFLWLVLLGESEILMVQKLV